MATPEEIDLLSRRVVNVVGHELRTPVTTVRGLAESLAEASDEPTRRALTSALVRSTARLEGLLDELLLAAGVFTAVPTGRPSRVDLADALRRAGWSADIDGDASALVVGESLDRILHAIVDNAGRHGDPTVARLSTAGDRVMIDVESSGSELPAGDVALACEPFFRGERAVMTAPGLGLGLAIARTIARAEGGDVEARARDGGGLVLRVTLCAS